MSRRFVMAQALFLLLFVPAFAASVGRFVAQTNALYEEKLFALYADLHQHPELSGQETRTSKRVAESLRSAGLEVSVGVGGNGVVGVFRNGTGKTVLLRADMDALPVAEKTGLPYASAATATFQDGSVVPVSHACGHDVHMVSVIGATELLVANRSRWRGTLVVVGQPSEETARGARAMLADGLYTRFPKPDYALAIHDTERRAAGDVEVISGYAGAIVDSVFITVRGKGAHGSRPQQGIDPIVLASAMVLRFQAIVAREVDPMQPAVITVGAFNAGLKENVIPDVAELKLTVRSTDPGVREQLLVAITRVANAEAEASGAPPPPRSCTTSASPPRTTIPPWLRGFYPRSGTSSATRTSGSRGSSRLAGKTSGNCSSTASRARSSTSGP